MERFFEEVRSLFYLIEMSDGSARMLYWATILLSPELPALLVIEEPEIGILPAWTSVPAEWIKKASRRTQVIISTHSPDLLDHFTDSIENDLCFSCLDHHHSSLVPLSGEKREPRFAEGWQLGDLYRVGDPGVGGWPW